MTTVVTIAQLQFASPMWLLAAGAVAIPILVHFFAQRRTTEIVLPSIVFLRQVTQTRSHQFRLTNILILALRCTIIIAIAIAFAQPIWSNDNPNSDSQASLQHNSEIILILDASSSMTRDAQNKTIFKTARDAILTKLNTLQDTNTPAAVIIATAHPTSLLPKLTTNIQPLIRLTKDTHVTHEHANMPAAVQLASTMRPTPDPQANREIHIYTDTQQTQFPNPYPESTADSLHNILNLNNTPQWGHVVSTLIKNANTRIIIHKIQSDKSNVDNITISIILAEPAQPQVGEDTQITVEVSNLTPHHIQQRVLLYHNDNTPLVHNVDIQPFAKTYCIFHVRFETQGIHELTATIADPGSYHIDDAASHIVKVQDKIHVGIIGAEFDSNNTIKKYIATALAPDDAANIDLTWIDPTNYHADNLQHSIILEQYLCSFDVLVLCNTTVPSNFLHNLMQAVSTHGNSLLWMISSPEDVAQIHTFHTLAPDNMKPNIQPVKWFDLAGSKQNNTRTRSVKIRDGQFEHTALQTFQGPLRRALQDITFQSYMPITFSDPAKPLLRLDTGDPLLVTTPLGAGQYAVFTANINPANSTFVKSPLFPIFMYDIVQYLDAYQSTTTQQQRIFVGDPVPLQIDLRLPDIASALISTSLQLSDFRFDPEPKGRIWIEQGTTNGNTMTLRLPPANTPGIIRAHLKSTPNTAAAVAVQLDSRESDFKPIPYHLLQSLLITGSYVSSSAITSPSDDWTALEIDYHTLDLNIPDTQLAKSDGNTTDNKSSLLSSWLPQQIDGSISLWPLAIILALIGVILEQFLLIIHRVQDRTNATQWRGGVG